MSTIVNDEGVVLDVKRRHTPAGAIANALYFHGYKTQKSQAEIVGEDDAAWGRYTRGLMSPSTKKVQGWLDAINEMFAAAEMQGIQLLWSHRGASFHFEPRR